MNDNQLLLKDRLDKIREVIAKYGEEKFCISFSGGKDSTVMSALIDMAIPDNEIPRVYANTGIELNMIRDFVRNMAELDERIVIIKPTTPIKQMLEKEGYPFKSKAHARWVSRFQRIGRTKGVVQYLGERKDKEPWSSWNSCPQKLKYQFTEEFNMKISDICCVRLKEDPLVKYANENGKKYHIIGIMKAEGGRRQNAQCLAFRGTKLYAFQPLAPVTKEWEDWFIKEYNIDICDIYKPPYNFTRTGCKGCPFAKDLQHELDILEKFFPNERKQCELIWKPVYEEYRRIGYRLKKKDEFHQMTVEDYLKEKYSE